MAERLEWEECPNCHGSGGPDPIWDDDIQRSVTYVCASCSGQGYRKVWHD